MKLASPWQGPFVGIDKFFFRLRQPPLVRWSLNAPRTTEALPVACAGLVRERSIAASSATTANPPKEQNIITSMSACLYMGMLLLNMQALITEDSTQRH